MQLAEIMTANVVTIAPDDPASAAWTRMRRRGIRHLVVVDDGRLVGVVSERDLGGRLGAAQRRGQTVGSAMASAVVTATPTMGVRAAADLMRAWLIGSLPVLEGDRLVGIVTATDVFDALTDQEKRGLSQAERQLLRAPTSSRKLGGRPVPRSRSRSLRRTKESSLHNRTKRAAMTSSLARATKRALGRTEAPFVPVAIRTAGVEVDDKTRDDIRRRLGRTLGKFALPIERVTVRLEDVNGPRGGIDHHCRIKVVLSGLPSVVAEARAAGLGAATHRAMAAAERAVRRTLQRQRMPPRSRAARRSRRRGAQSRPDPIA